MRFPKIAEFITITTAFTNASIEKEDESIYKINYSYFYQLY